MFMPDSNDMVFKFWEHDQVWWHNRFDRTLTIIEEPSGESMTERQFEACEPQRPEITVF